MTINGKDIYDFYPIDKEAVIENLPDSLASNYRVAETIEKINSPGLAPITRENYLLLLPAVVFSIIDKLLINNSIYTVYGHTTNGIGIIINVYAKNGGDAIDKARLRRPDCRFNHCQTNYR